jgi:thiol-disulfide isomerase/thioredoxin
MKRSKALGFLFVLLIASVAVYSLSSKNKKISDSPSSSPHTLIPDTLLNQDGKEVPSKLLKGKYVGLYFSASWCGPCRSFTPELIRFRNLHTENFEVVLVGGDGSPQDQANYVKKYKMPWLSMINQSDAAKHVSKSLEVQYIPYLVILDPSGKVVSKDGVKDLKSLKDGAMKLWASAHKDA